MFGLFKKCPIKETDKIYKAKLTEALNAQRNGDIKSYAKFSAEAEEILKQLNALKDQSSSS